MSDELRITAAIALSAADIEETFVRAPGPGGQNVNKVASAVQLRFALERSIALPEEVKQRLRRIAGKRISGDGWLLIDAHRYREQARNREDARARLIELIRKALERPKPRRATRPSAASKERRLAAKRVRSRVKESRGKRDED